MPDLLTVEEFAAAVKRKHPDYAEVDDYDLTHRYLNKHPDYKESVAFGPRERTYAAAARAGISRDLADDFLTVTSNVESGNRHYRQGVVLKSPVNPKTGERAIGFSQILPSTIKPYGLDPYDEDQNIEGGLRYFSEGGDDPVARRIHYFGGPGALKKYQQTGRIPKGQDVTGTTFEKYVKLSSPKSPKGDRRYDVQAQVPAQEPSAIAPLRPNEVPAPELDTSARRPRSIHDDPTKEPVGYMAEIRKQSPEFESKFYDFLQANTPPTSKAKTVGQAAGDQSMAWSFLKIADFAQKNKGADANTINKGLSQIGVEFLRNPETSGSQLPTVLHEAMLAAQYTPEEWNVIPEKLRQQIRQYRTRVAVQRGREKQVAQLQQDVETLGPTVGDWLPDLDWHLRMSPEEFQSLTKAQQRKVVNLVAQRVRDDQLRRQAGQAIAAPSVEEEIRLRNSLGLPRRPVKPLDIGNVGTERAPSRQPYEPKFSLPDADLRSEARQQVLAERKGRREGAMTQARSSLALADTAVSLEQAVEERVTEMKRVDEERKRLLASFTPQEKQLVTDLSQQLAGHGTGVKRGVDIGIQGVTSSFLYKLGGLFDLAQKIQRNTAGESWLPDWFKKQALAGELSIESVRQLPSNRRQDVAEFITSVAASLPEAVGATAAFGPVAGFAGLGASEAQGRGLGSGEVLREGVKGALIGKVFDWSDLISVSSAPASVKETVKRLGKKASTIGAGTAAVELGTGTEPKEAIKAALTNALLPVVMAPLHGKAKVETKGGADARTRTPVQPEGRPAGEPYNAGAVGEGVVEGRGESSGLRQSRKSQEEQVVPEEAKALPRVEDVVRVGQRVSYGNQRGTVTELKGTTATVRFDSGMVRSDLWTQFKPIETRALPHAKDVTPAAPFEKEPSAARPEAAQKPRAEGAASTPKTLTIHEADRQRLLEDPEFQNVLMRESVGGNAGEGRAAVNMAVDAEGRIVSIGNIQDLPQEIQSALRSGELKNATAVIKYDDKLGHPQIERFIVESEQTTGPSEVGSKWSITRTEEGQWKLERPGKEVELFGSWGEAQQAVEKPPTERRGVERDPLAEMMSETRRQEVREMIAKASPEDAAEMRRLFAASKVELKPEVSRETSPVGDVPEPNFGPGTMRAGEPLPEVKERKFGKRFVEDERIAQEIRDSIGTAKYYEPISNKVTVKDATRLIDERGLPQALKDVRDESSNLPFRVRVAMGEEAVLRLNQSYKRLKEAKSPEAEFVLNQATDVSEFLMDYGTRLGQGVQQFAAWARLTPEGKLLSYKRAVDRAVKEREKKNPEQAQEVKDIVAEVNKQVTEASEPAPEVLADASKAIRKAASKKTAAAKEAGKTSKTKAKPDDVSVWQKYKDGIARNLAALARPKGTGQKPPLQEFSDRLLRNVEGLITKPERSKTPDDVYAKMREVVENFDKYKEAWDEAVEFIRKKYEGKPPAELGEIERRITDLHSAFQTRAFDKVYNDAVKQAEINFKELARAHYENRTQTKDQLIRDIRERLGIELSPEDAAELAAKVTQRTAAQILTARERILAAMERGKNKTAKQIKSQTEQLIEAARIGVLNEQKFYEIAAEKLGLPKYDKDVAAKILELAGEVEAAPEGMPRDAKIFELNKYIAQQKGFSPGDLALGIYYGNILSGFNTHIVNAVDTMMNVVSEITGLALNNPRAAAKTYGGMLQGFTEGRLDSLLALTQGRMVTDGKWLEIPKLMEIAEFGKKGGVPIKVDTRIGRATKAVAESKIGYPLNAYKYVTRLLAASDAVFFRTAKEARASLLAYRIAQGEGLKGDLLESRVQQILGMDREADFSAQAKREGFTGTEAEVRAKELRDMVRDKDLSADAAEFAGEATYNHEPHGVLGYFAKEMAKVSEKVKPLKLFVPFTRIVANVTNRGLNYTPWGLKRAFVGYSFEGPLTGEARRQMITRSLMGMVGINTLAALQAADYIQIHGNGPSDREKRRQMQAAGWRPYTIQIGDAYISYMYSPLALGLAVTGNMTDSQRYHELEQKDAATRGAYAVARLGSTIFSQSFLSGLSRLFGALSEEPSRSVTAVKQVLGSTVAAATTPNLARDIHRLFDNTAYQSNTLMEDLIRSTPFAGLALKPQLNAFGEPVKLQRQRFFDILSSDPAWRFVIEKGLRIPVPSKTTEIAKGERISPDEYYNLLLKTGPRLKQWITDNQKLLSEMKEQDAQEKVSKASAAITKDELEEIRKAKGMIRKRVVTPPTELTNPTDKRRSVRPRKSREWQYPSERREERQRRYNVQVQP